MRRASNYDMDEAQFENSTKRAILDLKVETQLCLQLLLDKGVCTREEVAAMRSKVRNSPKYAAAYQALDTIEASIQHYKDNPESHLRDLFKAKMNGDIT